MLQLMGGSQIAKDDYYIQHMKNGMDELHFEVSIYDPVYRELLEEARIYESTEQQIYTVKSISASKKTAKIGCRLDLSDWQKSICIGFARKGTPRAFLIGATMDFLGDSAALSAWSIEDSTVPEERRIEMKAPTPLELAMQVQESFGCAVRFHTNSKTAKIIWYDQMEISNSYVVDTVNLISAPEFKGKSSELYTRLYPIGKNGLRIDGDYVENLSYTDQIICAVWEDNRYTDADTLKADAQKRVDEASQPVRSWKLSVADLFRLNPNKWPEMSLELFTKLRLVDNLKGFSAIVQVMEDKIYPHYPEKNMITVSTCTSSIQRTLRALYKQIYDPNSSFHQQFNA